MSDRYGLLGDRQHRRRAVLVVLVVVLVFALIFGIRGYVNKRGAQAAKAQGPPPAAVSTGIAERRSWTSYTTVVGSLAAVRGTLITAQIAGNVTRIAFESGQAVRAGDLLVQLENSTQLAQLHADEAKLALARTTLARTERLYKINASSESDLQTAQANAHMAQAAVEADKSVLAKLAITAPFSGKTGIRSVSLGQYIAPGAAIVDLQSYDPILLDFSLPQSRMGQVATGNTVEFSVNAYPGRIFTGRITALGARIDPATRTISLQATLPNPQALLRPAMYGDVRLVLGRPTQGVVIPNTAVSYNTFGDFVYLVQPRGQQWVVHQRVVKVADQRDQLALVTQGLQGGETVVTAGQNKLHEGAVVVVNNAGQP
jgi:membrane fusion protein (multidrug efflux system)